MPAWSGWGGISQYIEDEQRRREEEAARREYEERRAAAINALRRASVTRPEPERPRYDQRFQAPPDQPSDDLSGALDRGSMARYAPQWAQEQYRPPVDLGEPIGYARPTVDTGPAPISVGAQGLSPTLQVTEPTRRFQPYRYDPLSSANAGSRFNPEEVPIQRAGFPSWDETSGATQDFAENLSAPWAANVTRETREAREAAWEEQRKQEGTLSPGVILGAMNNVAQKYLSDWQEPMMRTLTGAAADTGQQQYEDVLRKFAPEKYQTPAAGEALGEGVFPYLGATNRLLNPYHPETGPVGISWWGPMPIPYKKEPTAAGFFDPEAALAYAESERKRKNAYRARVEALPDGEMKDRMREVYFFMQGRADKLESAAAEMEKSIASGEPLDYLGWTTRNASPGADFASGMVFDLLNLADAPIGWGVDAVRMGQAAKRAVPVATEVADEMTAAAEVALKKLNAGEALGRRRPNPLLGAASQAYAETTTLFRGMQSIFNKNITLKGDYATVLDALLTNPQGLADEGVMLLSPAPNLLKKADGRVAWGPGVIRNKAFLEVRDVLKMAEPALRNMRSLDPEVGGQLVNPTEFATEMATILQEAARKRHGLDGGSLVPVGATKARAGVDINGNATIEFLSGTGEKAAVVRTIPAPDAQTAANQANKFNRQITNQRNGLVKAGKWVNSAQKEVVSHAFLGGLSRPYNTLQNWMGALQGQLANRTGTFVDDDVILRQLNKKFGDVAAPNLRVFETQRGAQFGEAGQQAGQPLRDLAAKAPGVGKPLAWLADLDMKIPYGKWAIPVGKGKSIAVPEQSLNLRSFWVPFDRMLRREWTKASDQGLLPRLTQLVGEQQARGLNRIVTDVGIAENAPEIMRQVDDWMRRGVMPADLKKYGIRLDDELLGPEQAAALQKIIATKRPEQVQEALAEWQAIVESRKNQLADMMSAETPPLAPRTWTKDEAADSAMQAAKNAQDTGRMAKQDSTEVQQAIADALKQENTLWQSVLDDVAGAEMTPNALGVLADFYHDMRKLKASTRRRVDEALDAAGDAMGTPQQDQMWKRAYAIQRDSWKGHALKLDELGVKARTELADVLAGKPYTQRTRWADVVQPYLASEPADVLDVRAGIQLGRAGTASNAEWAAVREAARQLIDNKMIEVADAFRLMPTQENMDLLIHAHRWMDRRGEVVKAAINKLPDGDGYAAARNKLWGEYRADALAYGEQVKRAMVAQGLGKSVASGLTWTDGANTLRLMGPQKNGNWAAWDTTSRAMREVPASAVPANVMAEWGDMQKNLPAAYNKALDSLKNPGRPVEPPPVPPPTTINPTRDAVRQQLIDVAKMPEEQANAVIAITDARAKFWASKMQQYERASGVHRRSMPEDWYKTYFNSVQEELAGWGKAGASMDMAAGIMRIHSVQSRDIGTVMHEIGHALLRDASQLAYRTGDAKLVKDMKAIEKWLAVDMTDEWTTQAEELFADTFVTYLRSGKAPTKELDGAFATVRQWASEWWRAISDLIRPLLKGDVYGAIDRMLTEAPEIRRGKRTSRLPEWFGAPVDTPAGEGVVLHQGGRSVYVGEETGQGLAGAFWDADEVRLPDGRTIPVPPKLEEGAVLNAVQSVGNGGMPAISDVAGEMLDNLNTLYRNVADNLPDILRGEPHKMTPAQGLAAKDAIRRHVTDYYDRAVNAAADNATRVSDWVMVNSARGSTDLDTAIGTMIPFTYYWSRMIPRALVNAFQKPSLMNLYYELMHAAQVDDQQQRAESGIPYPARLEGTNLVGSDDTYEYRLDSGKLFRKWIPVQSYVDEAAHMADPNDELETGWDIVANRMFPLQQYAMNAALDTLQPRKDGTSRNADFDFADLSPAARTWMAQAAASETLPLGLEKYRMFWLKEDTYNPYRARRGVATTLQENLDPNDPQAPIQEAIAHFAQQIITNFETGKEPMAGIPEMYQEQAMEMAELGVMRAADEVAKRTGSSTYALPITSYPHSEGELATAQQAYWDAGYDPATGEGSKAAQREVIEQTPALPVFWSRGEMLPEDDPESQAQRGRDTLYHAETDEINQRMNAAADNLITTTRQMEGRDPTEGEMNDLKGPYFDELKASKERWEYEPKGAPSRKGMNPREEAHANIGAILQQEYPGKPEYPAENDEEFEKLPIEQQRKYYEDLAAWRLKNNAHVEKLLQMQTNPMVAKWSDPAVAVEFRNLVMGQYGTDLMRRYENRFVSDVEYHWAEQQALEKEVRNANWKERENEVRRFAGNEGVAKWNEYNEASDEQRKALRESDPIYTYLNAMAYNPKEYAYAVAAWGSNWYKTLENGPEHPGDGATDAQLDTYFEQLGQYNLAHPEYEQIRLWYNGRPGAGEKGGYRADDSEDGKHWEPDYGEDYEKLLAREPDIFKYIAIYNQAYDRYNNSVGTNRSGHDNAQGPWATVPNWEEVERKVTGYKEWKAEYADKKDRVLPALPPEPMPLAEDYTGPRPYGTDAQPILPDGANAAPPDFVRPAATEDYPFVNQALLQGPNAGKQKKGESKAGGAETDMASMDEYAMRDKDYVEGLAKDKQFAQNKAEKDALWAQARELFGEDIQSIVYGYDPDWTREQKQAYYEKYPQILKYWDWRYGDDGKGGSSAAFTGGGRGFTPYAPRYSSWGGGGGGGFEFDPNMEYTMSARIDPRFFDSRMMPTGDDIRRWQPWQQPNLPDWLRAGDRLQYQRFENFRAPEVDQSIRR